MSSLRNAVKRRAHKERPQPSERRRLGLLEKHKDYVLRARDFHKKEETIRNLKEKAAFRNPDEFYYKMINSRTVNGVHRSKSDGKQYSEEEMQLMRTHDIGYLLTKAQIERKKVDRLKSDYYSINDPPSNKHVYYADERDEAEKLGSEAPERPHGSRQVPNLSKGLRKELQERSERAEKLRQMAMTMSLQKQLTGKGRKRKSWSDEVGTCTEQPVYKWRQERKT